MQYKVIVLALVIGLTSALPPSKPKLARPSRSRGAAGPAGSRLGVFGGSSTTIAKHPHLVSILESGYQYCGGAILNDKWVVTSSMCTSVFGSSDDILVVAGSNDGITGDVYSVAEAVLHPKIDEYGYSYNYGLIKINGTFNFGTKVANVSLPSADPESHTAFLVAGYGDTEYVDLADSGESVLQQGVMKWQPTQTCTNYYTTTGWDESQACIYNGKKVTLCNGDYGVPVVKDGVVYAVNVGTAEAFMCTNQAWPVVVANLYPVTSWIQSITGAVIA